MSVAAAPAEPVAAPAPATATAATTATANAKADGGGGEEKADVAITGVTAEVKKEPVADTPAATAKPEADPPASDATADAGQVNNVNSNCSNSTASEVKEEPPDPGTNCAGATSPATTPTSTATNAESTNSNSTASTAVVASNSSPSTSQSASSTPTQQNAQAATPAQASAPAKPSAPASNPLTMSSLELEMLSELTSAAYGHVKLTDERFLRKRKLALKAITYMEQTIATRNYNSRKRKADEDAREKAKSSAASSPVSPKVYCKLGHLHLLMEDYKKALSAYRKYNLLAADEARSDVLFLYGQGLVFFHFNAYLWASRAFQQALYVQPGFERSNEIHARLGIMAKINGDFASSLKHLQLAKKGFEMAAERRPSVLTEDELQFHIAHLHEIHGKHAAAINMYTELLNKRSDSLSPSLKAEIHRQLGWTYYSVETLGNKHSR